MPQHSNQFGIVKKESKQNNQNAVRTFPFVHSLILSQLGILQGWVSPIKGSASSYFPSMTTTPFFPQPRSFGKMNFFGMDIKGKGQFQQDDRPIINAENPEHSDERLHSGARQIDQKRATAFRKNISSDTPILAANEYFASAKDSPIDEQNSRNYEETEQVSIFNT